MQAADRRCLESVACPTHGVPPRERCPVPGEGRQQRVADAAALPPADRSRVDGRLREAVETAVAGRDASKREG